MRLISEETGCKRDEIFVTGGRLQVKGEDGSKSLLDWPHSTPIELILVVLGRKKKAG